MRNPSANVNSFPPLTEPTLPSPGDALAFARPRSGAVTPPLNDTPPETEAALTPVPPPEKPDSSEKEPAKRPGIPAFPGATDYPRWLVPALFTGGFLTFASAATSGFLLWNGSQDRAEALRVQTIGAAMARLDETVTSSARLAIATGESRWATRFDNATGQMSESLKTLTGMPFRWQRLRETTAELNTAWHSRIGLERRAIALTQAGNVANARSVVYSPSYEAQKATFARLLGQLNEVVQKEAAQGQAWEGIGLVAAGAAALLSFGLLTVSTSSAQAARRRWRQESYERGLDAKRAQDELASTQRRMEVITRELRRLEKQRSAQEVRLHHNREIDRQIQLLEQAIEAAEDVVMIAVTDEIMPRVVRVNRAFYRMTGYSESEIEGRSPKMLQGPETDPNEVARISGLIRTRQPVQAELLNYRKDGSTFWVQLNIQPVFDDQNYLKYWISIQRDVTERKLAEARMVYQATHDGLTGLPNRNLFEERLGQALIAADTRGVLVGVLFLDLDNFKSVNDSLGHAAGDRFLQQVATRLQTFLHGDEIVARFGGDEFTILLPNITGQTGTGQAGATDVADLEGASTEASLVADRLLKALDAAPFMIEGHELTASASIGISIGPTDGRDIGALLRNADTAMYRAKDQGRGSFQVYNKAMNARVLDRLQIEGQLRRAMERNEFYLLYQPQVALRTGIVFGAEALLRWQNDILGRISPAQFIPIAEESDLIIEIGGWALDQACKQAADWHSRGCKIRMSVNLSAKQFAQPNLTAQVRKALETHGLPAEYLDIEITETTLLNGPAAAATLHELKALGVRLSVDDFGVGYSSLSYLSNLPLDVLKIDRSFVMGIGQDHKSDVMVRWLVELASEMKFEEVIAEGVETEQQRAELIKMGCQAMQGYLFSPPVPAPQVERLAEKAAELSALITALETAPPLRPKDLSLPG